ncbi:MAG: hypothetical protein JWO90_560, partial [Solirubrobacterales bacterium]|nr:hypothetical protein [Solirubrobacterales bacterium]
ERSRPPLLAEDAASTASAFLVAPSAFAAALGALRNRGLGDPRSLRGTGNRVDARPVAPEGRPRAGRALPSAGSTT